jgi:putative acetyltransferase
MEFVLDDLSGAAIRALLHAHLQEALELSPPESMHALDLDGLRQPGLTFWSVWREGELLGCCALKELDPTHGEIKSMRTASAHRRQGVGAAMLRHLLAQAQARGYRRLSLETGSMAAFEPARQMYARHGFEYCGPFAHYIEDPYSVFMTRQLDGDAPPA